MSERACKIERYISELFAPEDGVLSSLREEARALHMPDIHVPAYVGKLLYCLVIMMQPKKVLEVGTLAGYSAIWLARALPPKVRQEARLISLELFPHHAALARQKLEEAGLTDRAEVREGLALAEMRRMVERGEGPFDIIFIDADKKHYPAYLEQALLLSRPGSLILSDNLIPRGEEIGDATQGDENAEAIYHFNRLLADHPRLESSLITTIADHHGRIDALGLSIVRR